MKLPNYYFDTEFQRFTHAASGAEAIMPISIGIVCDDGREYYAENDYPEGFLFEPWVVDNVISKLTGPKKPLLEIGTEISAFIHHDGAPIYAYYSHYDWVCLCAFFGGMLKVPGHIGMYCHDLKILMDYYGLDTEWKRANCPDPEGEHNALVDARWNKQLHDAIMNHHPF